MKCKYDERQKLVRGTGFKYGFFTLMIYDFLYGALDLGFVRPIMDTFTAMMIGVAIAVLVYVSYCIWNEGYYSLNENPRRVMICFGAVALINLVLSFQALREGRLVQNGMLSFHCTNLICGIVMAIILCETWLKWIQVRKEAE